MQNLWRDDEARGLGPIDLLVYRSRLYGRDPVLVLWGGGNTSLKHDETDFRGRPTAVLRIKGSGADLKAITASDFPALRLDDLLPLQERAAMEDEAMVDWLRRCLLDPGARRPSIETLLHAFVPHAHVDHTHADAILALADQQDARRHVEAALGSDAVFVPYRRPGFLLSKEVGEAVRSAPKARCAVLERHGLIAWGESARESYETTIGILARAGEYARDRAQGRVVLGPLVHPPLEASVRRRLAARLLPRLRGALARAAGPGAAGATGGAADPRVILRHDDDPDLLDFVGREGAASAALAGPATPDHLMYTRVRPLVVSLHDRPLTGEADADRLAETCEREIGKYADWYRLFVRKHGGDESRVDPRPRLLLVPGLGAITAWKDARHARIVADIARHGTAVMRAASGIGEYRSLGLQDAFDIEFWPLELYRMSLQPKEAELGRRVALVTGAARGIGRGTALRLAAAGCHVAVTDRDGEGARSVADAVVAAHGEDRAIACALDVTDEASVAAGFEAATLAWGGVDVLVSNAGIAHVSSVERMERRDWDRVLAVNATGHFLVSREAVRLMKTQGTGGSIVVIGSKNVLAPGKDFGAYSASKAAQVQLARVLAIEAAPDRIRVNIVHPDAVFQDSGLWSEEVRQERARAHGIAPTEIEEFYRKRNLLGENVTAEDVAEAVLWLASDRSLKTTGCILTVDGGLREAFPR
ncbi:MAG TPA: bifunctional rhamnulose-1-phosphate aldolase/short-chain dehydrogenase [Candidatus Polarisedimenticolia bacterium]|nr:bifunctional rhamnulose-1-phosphate aldolase/short-chain dehydrogenase [Candidatus Polarisedimenticolia bacterium]